MDVNHSCRWSWLKKEVWMVSYLNIEFPEKIKKEKQMTSSLG